MGSRVVFDKRTLRKRYGAAFSAAIRDYDEGGSFLDEIATQMGGDPSPLSNDEPVQVFARKRPMFEDEASSGEFDVVRASPHGLLVHACRTRADLRSPFLATHYSPLFAFGEAATNAEVVARIGLAQLIDAAARGGDAALCCFGQTGSGKSHTMAAVLQEAAHLLFGPSGALARRGLALRLSAYEVCGPAAFDLLVGGREKLRAREDAAGAVVLDAAAAEVADGASLQRLLAGAARARRTAATARNAGSSRSHAFYELRLAPLSAAPGAARAHAPRAAPGAGGRGAPGGGCGSLLLVDLAGSERNADSAAHDSERQQQSAEINSGLSTLKECFRQRNAAARAGGADPPPHVPYRESLLTRLMKRVLEPPAGGGSSGNSGGPAAPQPRVVVVATVSPCASDTEATLNTLRHAAVMSGLRMERDSDMLLEESDVDAAAPAPAPAPAPAAKGARQPAQQQHQQQQQQHHHHQHHQQQHDQDWGGERQQHHYGTPPPAAANACAGAAAEAPPATPPAKWSADDVRRWVQEAGGGRFKAAAAALPPSVDGKAFSRFPEVRFKQLFGADEAAARRGRALYDLFREEVRAHSAKRLVQAQAARDVGPLADSARGATPRRGSGAGAGALGGGW